MAQDSDVPTSADKGKGKAPEKDDKPVANGKTDDEKKKDCKRQCIVASALVTNVL